MHIMYLFITFLFAIFMASIFTTPLIVVVVITIECKIVCMYVSVSSADDLHNVLNCGRHLQAASVAITGSTIASAACATLGSSAGMQRCYALAYSHI